MTVGWQIVRLTGDDWQEHRDLRLLALRTNPEAFGASYADNAAYDEATWRARLESVTYWQARIQAEPVGMVGLWDVVTEGVDPRESAPYLIAMFVAPTHRGAGVGEALVRTLLAQARARGHTHVVLDVNHSNRSAARLYERVGFRFTGDSWGPDPSGREWKLSMVCALG
jgi:ribosomal protein S18 acetylase RimI-like enzyme